MPVLKNQKKGFSIIEIIISLSIIGVLFVLYGLINRTLVFNQEVKYQEVALRIVRTEIETLRALPYASLPSAGPFTNPMLANLPQGTGIISVAAYNSELKSITATVSWTGPGASTRSVSVDTLIGQGGL